MLSGISSAFDLLLCRPGMEEALCREAEMCHGLAGQPAGPGMLLLPAGKVPAAALVFERQRLPRARLIRMGGDGVLPADADGPFWQSWREAPAPWALQLYAAEEEGGGLARQLPGLERALRRNGERLIPGLRKWERKPEKLFREQKGLLFQWLRCREGLWVSAAGPGELTATAPAGRYRMAMDAEAPSRSYLKVEEALFRMGISPADGERVIDLGAAPGGWTYAFAKRGCQVTAVDNGPLRISSAAARRVEHLHRDGMTFRPDRHLPPVDWLAGDMLVPPGQAFGLLKYWVGERRCRRLILNIKLPQEDPVPPLLPILDWLKGRGAFQIRQLYHDRTEVTVFGTLS
jgi:hypothetical protein